ncbi:hypothetical protein BLJ79_06210 [Arthrobacter sp. UCD-GKA]|nr:hypothetical protein BLJ79_06210 [Arthrobacter sp. UCD-GKA]
MKRTVEYPGRTAVVTGGASGIGKGLAASLKKRGMDVVIADIDQTALDATALELGVVAIRTDVTDAQSVQALADRVLEQFGAVHVVCNNAGVGPMAPISELTLGDWKWMIDVNLFGVIHGVNSFLPLLKRNHDWGHIINTSSMSVLAPPKNLGAYVAAKAAVFGMTEVLAQELAAEGSVVGATALVPGPIRSNIQNSLRNRPANEEGALFDVDISENGKSFRFLEPHDVGELVIDAIDRGLTMAPTHPEWLGQVTERHQDIQAAFSI